MKNLKANLIPVLLISIFLFSCKGKTSEAQKNDDPPKASSESGGGNFSVSIDGAKVSGGKIDEMQLVNTGFIYPDNDKGSKKLLFFLNSDKKGDDFYSFRFSLPDKEGVYTFTKANNAECHCYLWLDFYLKSENNFPRYNEDSVRVSLDKITSTEISGTFSGRLTLSDDTRSKPFKAKVDISNGRFDIPFSTGNIRPE